MKKMLLAALTAFAMCSYSYAQDDDDEYEEDEAPAKVSKKKKAVSEDDEDEDEGSSLIAKSAEGGMLGLGLDLVSAFDDNGVQKFYVTFRMSESIELSAILGFYHHGETTGDGNDEHNDNYTQLQLGVGADAFLQERLPISVGGEFLFSHWGDDNNQLDFNFLAGTRVKLAKDLYLSAKLGLGINIIMDEGDVYPHDEDWRIDFGLVTRAQLHWFFM